MKLVADVAEGVIVAKAAVDSFVVSSVISMLNGFKNRAEINSINVHLFKMRYPVKDFVETVGD